LWYNTGPAGTAAAAGLRRHARGPLSPMWAGDRRRGMGLDQTRTDEYRMNGPTTRDEGAARRPSRVAGLGWGLIYGLAYGLTVWGIDARVLARSNAELAGTKLALGLPLLLLIGAVTGALAGRSDRAGSWVGAWMASGALMGIVVAAMPMAGHNLATWIIEPRLRGVNVYPMGPGGAARMVFVTVVNGCVGAAVGLVGHLLVERARNLAAPTGRMSGRSWAALAVCLPLALLPGLLSDELINQPLRIGQRVVHESIPTGPVGGSTEGEAGLDRDPLSTGYTLHLVDYDLEEQGRATIDVAFEDGFVMRCEVAGRALSGCAPISPRFEAWMGDLVQAGLRGGPGPQLESQEGQVSVSENVSSWLGSQGEYLSGNYEVSRDAQRGGWVVMAARFDSGYTLTCWLHSASPVLVERCSGNPEA
jgi:hypothetical protein